MTAQLEAVTDAALRAEIARLRQQVADLEDLVQAARDNVERQQTEHLAYRAAHKGSCTHPSCRLRVPHGHSGGA